MKTYNQFVTESYSARENIQEALPLLAAVPAALKLGGAALSAYSGYQTARKLRQGDDKGAGLEALGIIPAGGLAARGVSKLPAVANLINKGNKIQRGVGKTVKAATGLAADSASLALPTEKNKLIDKGIQKGFDAITGTKRATATGTPDPSVTDTKSTTPSNNTVANQKPKTTQPTSPTTKSKPSSVVLARLGGVQGKLDKATGKWTKGDWTQKESDRYKRVAALKNNK